MRTVSASIVVLAGTLVLAGGSLVHHSNTQTTLQMVGSAVGLYGLIVWHREMHASPCETHSSTHDASGRGAPPS